MTAVALLSQLTKSHVFWIHIRTGACVWMQRTNTCPQTLLCLCVDATHKHLSMHLTAPARGCNTQTPVHAPYCTCVWMQHTNTCPCTLLTKVHAWHLSASWEPPRPFLKPYYAPTGKMASPGLGKVHIYSQRHLSHTQNVSLCGFCDHNPGHPNRTRHRGPIARALPSQPSDHQWPDSQPRTAAMVTSRHKHWRQTALVGSSSLAPSAAMAGNGSQWFFVKNDMPPVSSEGRLRPHGSTSEQVQPSISGASPA